MDEMMLEVPNLKKAKRNDDDPRTSGYMISKGYSPTKRLFLVFNNGLALSIVQGHFTYGGQEGLYEIAPMTEDCAWAPWLFDEEDKGDDVLGYLPVERVQYYIDKIANIGTEECSKLHAESLKDASD